ncbi:MAG: 1-acyl-sn-glycerol-3-phosphate acyltransferase [Myxococcales bacterium]|jgi:1-acyl-sn-glycerol-3-phosphate acyltransferase|nr:1-acyl-sn-glycerol-3-phosphate acyltransferase [Myxococcales bacterium]
MPRRLAIARLLLAIPPFLLALGILGGAIVASGLFTKRFHPFLFRTWARVTLWIGGIRMRAEGAQHIDPCRQYIFVANHQSILDIPLITAALPQPPRFVAKSSLDRIPFFSAIMRQLGTVPIDRSNHVEAIAKLREARSSLVKRQGAVIFFAEGTRTRDGELLPFKKGAVVTALALQAPLVPIAIAGAFEALSRNEFALRPGPVRVVIGEPIAVGEDTPDEKERLMESIQQRVRALYEGIRHDLDPAKREEGAAAEPEAAMLPLPSTPAARRERLDSPDAPDPKEKKSLP